MLPLHQKISVMFTEKALYQLEPVASGFQNFMRMMSI
jgi:hypothetical protein